MKTTIAAMLALTMAGQLHAQQLVVDGYQKPLRSSLAGPITGQLNRGSRLEVIERRGDWLKVKVEGWIRNGQLSTAPTDSGDPSTAVEGLDPSRLLLPRLLKKGFSAKSLNEMIWLDVDFDTSNLPRATRAIKGALIISDLFGDTIMRIYWTINEPLTPGQTHSEKGTNFAYNDFLGHHQWVRFTEIEDMQVSFEVSDIIFEDGERAAWYR